jgi:urease accessory protein
MDGLATLLLLTDGRFPSGGHAHSGGLEAAVAAGRVHDLSSLAAFLEGRLATTGMVTASFAAASGARAGAGRAPEDVMPALAELEEGMDARTPSAALRRASRRQGRALLRAARAIWPDPILGALARRPGGHPEGPHHPVVLGVAAAAAGLDPARAALSAAYAAVAGPATASVRLLGLDPYPVHAQLARLGPACERIAAQATEYAYGSVGALPASGAPLLEITAEVHATWEVRLFAS